MEPKKKKMNNGSALPAVLSDAELEELKRWLSSEEGCPGIGADTARKLLDMNDRILVLQKHSLREKIIAFLDLYKADDGGEFSVPFSREGTAEYLGCDRSALSRELARMSADGMIEYNRNRFRVLK